MLSVSQDRARTFSSVQLLMKKLLDLFRVKVKTQNALIHGPFDINLMVEMQALWDYSSFGIKILPGYPDSLGIACR